MSDAKVVYVVGSGAVGMGLAACLVMDGRRTVAVRTRDAEAPRKVVKVSLHHDEELKEVFVETVGLSQLTGLDGIVAVTAKAHANKNIAFALRNKTICPLVIMQNGLDVEKPFLEALVSDVY